MNEVQDAIVGKTLEHTKQVVDALVKFIVNKATLSSNDIHQCMASWLNEKGGDLANKPSSPTHDGTPVNDRKIPGFEKSARKFGVKYSIESDTTKIPTEHTIILKAKNVGDMKAAFRAQLGQEARRAKSPKEPFKARLQGAVAEVRNQVPDQTRNARREGHTDR